MQFVTQTAELLAVTPNAAQLLERCGRVCYKSEDKITTESAVKFVEKINIIGHHSVIEHAYATIRFVCDRGVSHELVRHRMASYSQESTRYCNYGKNKFNNEISVVEPPNLSKEEKALWLGAMCESEKYYLELIEKGVSPQIARSVLPNSLKTEIIMTCNFREWLHVFKLRTAKAAHPQIREVMLIAQHLLQGECPEVFGVQYPTTQQQQQQEDNNV